MEILFDGEISLVANKESPIVDALEVGAFTEDFDIPDLLTFIENSDHTDVIANYERLR